MFWVLLILGSVLLVPVGLTIRRRARRKRLMETPLPPAWLEILDRYRPEHLALSDAERKRLHGCIQVFLDEKRFEGCGGLEITDEIRVVIAAQACMLLLNRPVDIYPRLTTILVYPHTYVARNDPDHPEARLGESWDRGVVVLAWDSVRGGILDFGDGENVTLHEFAHQLDQADGVADGAPILESPSAYRTWARVLSREYEALRRRAERGRKTDLNRYGATNPAEFFAVATEAFFERPALLHRKHPDLYNEMKQYYRTDPLAWARRIGSREEPP